MKNELSSDSGFLLQNLMDNMSDSIYFKDRNSHFVMVNQTCAKKHGKDSPRDIIGETDSEVFTKEHAEKTFADEQKIIETGEALDNIEEKETWPDGGVTWVSTTKMPLKDPSGNIVGTFGISRDITEHKEDELRATYYAEQIKCIKEKMEEEVRMAAELQKTFFPRSYPTYPEGAEPSESAVQFHHHYHASGMVSGDFCSRLAAFTTGETGLTEVVGTLGVEWLCLSLCSSEITLFLSEVI